MAMGRRREVRQGELWVATERLASAPKHLFYDRLNALLDEAGFDRFCEALCASFYESNSGRESVPPGRYFRMILVGYFEGIDSQRGIEWRCSDSLSLRKFLFLEHHEQVPDHSSLTRTRDRLPLDIHQQVFEFVLKLVREKKLLQEGSLTVGVDSTLLEANAAMKSIVRKDSGEDWKAYLIRLMREEGLISEDDDDPDDEQLRRFDKSRKGKKVSNEQWESSTDPQSRIVKMKDGRTHLGYKVEHTIDLDSEVILAADVHEGTASDASTLLQSTAHAQEHLERSGSESTIDEVAADKGYHANQTLVDCRDAELRSYIPERKPTSKDGRRKWVDKSIEEEQAFRNNRRRMRGEKGRDLQRQRSEKVERSFAHVCETGGARRTWLRGIEKIQKRYWLVTAARNLGLLMRKLFGIGKPKALQDGLEALEKLAAELAFLLPILSRLFMNSTQTMKSLSLPKNLHRPLFTKNKIQADQSA